MPRVLIAGCGAVGTALGLLLAERGWEVWGLRRNPSLPAPIRPWPGDLTDPASLQALPPDLAAVCYTAAAGGYDELSYRAAYQLGIDNLVRALSRQGQSPERLLFTSSSSVYGEQGGGWVDEDTPPRPTSFAQRALLAGEALLTEAPWPAVIVRFGGIYGPGRTALVDQVRNGQADCVAGFYTNRIHEADCAGVLARLLSLPEPAPLYLAVDGEPAPLVRGHALVGGGAPSATATGAAGGRVRRPAEAR
jgi:nucleoside-diphosphate-sugar epimerase